MISVEINLPDFVIKILMHFRKLKKYQDYLLINLQEMFFYILKNRINFY